MIIIIRKKFIIGLATILSTVSVITVFSIFLYDYRLSQTLHEPPPLILVEGEIYYFFGNDRVKDIDTGELKYLGSVEANTKRRFLSLDLTPKENFHSSSFPIGTQIYRIDEESIYIEYGNYSAVGFNDWHKATSFIRE